MKFTPQRSNLTEKFFYIIHKRPLGTRLRHLMCTAKISKTWLACLLLASSSHSLIPWQVFATYRNFSEPMKKGR
jgi:hypothetical protein